jgi:hypothetical protein
MDGAFLQFRFPTGSKPLPPSIILLSSNRLKDLSVRFVIASKRLYLAQELLGFHWPPCINVAS